MRIHTQAELHTSGVVHLVDILEEESAALGLNEFQGLYFVEFVVVVGGGADGYEFYAEAFVVESVCIQFDCHFELITYGEVAHVGSLFANHFDLIPVCDHVLFPSGEAFSQFVVIRHEESVSFRQFVIELIEVVVDHTFHSEARCDLGDRVLDILYPLGAVAFGVLSVIERDDLVLEHLVDGSGIELILVRLVLVVRCSVSAHPAPST